MTMTDPDPSPSVVRFNITLFLYFVGAIVTGLLAWGSLKGDVQEFRTEFRLRMSNAERRLDRLEDNTQPSAHGSRGRARTDENEP